MNLTSLQARTGTERVVTVHDISFRPIWNAVGEFNTPPMTKHASWPSHGRVACCWRGESGLQYGFLGAPYVRTSRSTEYSVLAKVLSRLLSDQMHRSQRKCHQSDVEVLDDITPVTAYYQSKINPVRDHFTREMDRWHSPRGQR
jgi:hypothetical protein